MIRITKLLLLTLGLGLGQLTLAAPASAPTPSCSISGPKWVQVGEATTFNVSLTDTAPGMTLSDLVFNDGTRAAVTQIDPGTAESAPVSFKHPGRKLGILDLMENGKRVASCHTVIRVRHHHPALP